MPIAARFCEAHCGRWSLIWSAYCRIIATGRVLKAIFSDCGSCFAIKPESNRRMEIADLPQARDFRDMKLLWIFLLLPILLLIVGCGEPKADLSTPKTHRAGDLVFDYPRNWKIEEHVNSPELLSLFVETAGDALVILQAYPSDEAEDLAAFAHEFSKGTAEEISVAKIEGSTFAELPEAHGYQWLQEKFEIGLLGESVPHRRLYGARKIGSRQVFLILQVASGDYSKVKPGFDLIVKSLRGTE